MLSVYSVGDRNGVDGRAGFDGPDFCSGVGGVGGEFSAALSLENQISGGGEHASIGGDGFFY